jgi:hypothetical protein
MIGRRQPQRRLCPSPQAQYTTDISNTKQSHVPLPIAEELRRDLIVRFLAEIMQISGNPKDQADFQAALQTYCASLHPWFDASDDPLNPRAVFTLLECCTFDETGDNITVVLSPERPKPYCGAATREIRSGVTPD